jgi:hypothetical protein
MSIEVIIGVEMEPRVQFTIVVDSLDEMPDAIALPDGSVVVLSGRYLSPGDRYCYKRVKRSMIFSGAVKDWPRLVKLTG